MFVFGGVAIYRFSPCHPTYQRCPQNLQGNSPILDADSVELHTKLEALKVIDSWLLTTKKLVGGLKYLLFSHLFGEDFHFDEHIFQRG